MTVAQRPLLLSSSKCWPALARSYGLRILPRVTLYINDGLSFMIPFVLIYASDSIHQFGRSYYLPW